MLYGSLCRYLHESREWFLNAKVCANVYLNITNYLLFVKYYNYLRFLLSIVKGRQTQAGSEWQPYLFRPLHHFDCSFQINLIRVLC